MKVSSINCFFKKFGEWQIRHRFLLLFLICIIILIGLFGLRKSYFVNDMDQWMDETDEIEIATKKFESQFGNNESINILVTAENVFDPKILELMKKLGQEMLDSIPYAKEVISLADLELSIGNDEGINIINPFKDGIPTDIQEINKFRDIILSRQNLVNKIVSADCKEAWISLSLYEFPCKKEWEKVSDEDPLFQTGEAAVRLLTNPKWKSDFCTLKPVGMPYTETEEKHFMGKEIMSRIFMGFLAMILLLIIFVRSLRGVIIPALTTCLAIAVVFGFMGLLGVGINQSMVSLPIMLGMALAVGYSIHLINAFKRLFRQTGNRHQAAILSVEETGWPLFFTMLTTVGSVLSFTSAGIIAIRWVGYAGAGIVFTCYLFVFILIPIMFSFGKNREVCKEEKRSLTILERFMTILAQIVVRKKLSILIIFTLVSIILIPGIRKVSVNMDIFEIMGTEVDYMKRIYEVTQSQLGSYMSYNISVDYDKSDYIKNPEILNKFEKLSDLVSGFELTSKTADNASVSSILDIIKEMNRSLHGDSATYYRIPQRRDMIAQLLFLYEISGGSKLFNWIDEDYSMLRLHVNLRNYDANEIVRELTEIEAFCKKELPEAKISKIGTAAKFAAMNKKIVTGEIKSVLIAFIVIAILMIIVFGSFKTGLIGMIPNLIPMIAIGGYMGYFNLYLDMMTMTILPMVLGIAVDDTIHFINHIKYEFENCGNYQEAVIKSFQDVGSALAMTTIILTIGFGLFMSSPMANLVKVGSLIVLGLMFALLTDFLVTPALIIMTKPFGKERKKDK